MLCRYVTQLVTTEEKRIRFFIRGLNSKLQVLLVYMTSTRTSSNEVIDYSKKVNGVKRDGETKALSKRDKNYGNFHRSYARGSGQPTLKAKPI